MPVGTLPHHDARELERHGRPRRPCPIRPRLLARIGIWVLLCGIAGLASAASREPQVITTLLQPDGNRFVTGRGVLPRAVPLDIPLAGTPAWVVGAPVPDGSFWAVALQDGRLQGFRVRGRQATRVPLSTDRLPAGMPPVLVESPDGWQVFQIPGPAASPLASPVIVASTTATVDPHGHVALWRQVPVARLPLRALPDARLVHDGNGALLVLTDATSRYAHGVLGDAIEAASLTRVDLGPEPRVRRILSLPDPVVVEGTAPIWTDVTGDGVRDIVLTLSDVHQGARLVLFDDNGGRIAQGPPIGRGFRWRHQIAVAPFGPEGEREVVAVRTPHLGGVVEFYRLRGNDLQIVAEVGGTAAGDTTLVGDFLPAVVPGFRSHVLGSRNLEMAAAADFDGDGRIEVLVPTQNLRRLAGIRRQGRGEAAVVWTVPLKGRLTTNLAVMSHPDGPWAWPPGISRGDCASGCPTDRECVSRPAL